tara:strand:- start:346 stop:1281 length:936 start_codon:yes stop_codon:yes gene_type:complete
MVVGDSMLDEFHWCNVNRISPEAPVPVCSVKKTTLAPGGAANVAANLAALNVNVDLFGFIGSDSSGEKLSHVLSNHSINTDNLITTIQPTILKSRIIAQQQHVARIDRDPPSHYSDHDCHALLKQIQRSITDYQAIIISDYLKGLLTPQITQAIIQSAKEAGCLVVVDPKGDTYEKYKDANYLTPNYKEFCLATQSSYSSDDQLNVAAQKLRNHLNLDTLIITRSEKGMSIVTSNSFDTIATQAQEVFDITGAGDTAIACLAIGLCLDLSAQDAAILANYAAGIVVSKVGTAFVSPDELCSAINHDTATKS